MLKFKDLLEKQLWPPWVVVAQSNWWQFRCSSSKIYLKNNFELWPPWMVVAQSYSWQIVEGFGLEGIDASSLQSLVVSSISGSVCWNSTLLSVSKMSNHKQPSNGAVVVGKRSMRLEWKSQVWSERKIGRQRYRYLKSEWHCSSLAGLGQHAASSGQKLR